MKKVRKGVMCATDFAHELGEAPGGILVYRDKKDALAKLGCSSSCGLVEVEITLKKVILQGDMMRVKK